jgi:hypothetical protein
MEMAGSTDLRAHADLALALAVIGRPKDAHMRAVVAELRSWLRAGGLRRDQNRDGTYEHSDAVRIMDAWWPKWIRAEFQPKLGRTALDALEATDPIDNPPNGGGTHEGSSFQGAWFGYVSRDLRTILHRRVRGRYTLRYCGGGSRSKCRRVLLRSLRAAAGVPASKLYSGDPLCKAGDQECWDSIQFRPVGGSKQPLIPWINRPTFQQVVSVLRTVPR